MPAMVRISPAAHRRLRALAQASNSSLQQVLERAIEHERRRLLLAQSNEQYAKLRDDPGTWRKWKAELGLLDATLTDGI